MLTTPLFIREIGEGFKARYTKTMTFFFYGDNSYETAQAVAKLQAQYVAKTGGALDVQSFDMSDANLRDVLNALAVQPMFASSRLVIVRGLGTNKDAGAQIGDILKLVPKSTVLVLVDNEVDKRNSYFKTLLREAKSSEFTPLAAAKMRDWITARVRAMGGEIDSITAQKLYERVAHDPRARDRGALRRAGADQWQLEQEIIKLVSYDPKITSKTIELLVVANVEQTIFALVEAVAGGQEKLALQIYQNLITHGVADQQILAMLNWQYRTIVLARENTGGNAGWMGEFGISPYVASKAAGLGNRLDYERLVQAYELIVGADFSIKTGAKPSGLALEELIYQLAS